MAPFLVLAFCPVSERQWVASERLGSPGPFLNLRDRQCYKDDGSSKSPDCPVCSRSLNKLAQPLPMAHCANSRLVCKISGDVMNENNPPMMLPNGYVYGYNVSGGGAWGRGRALPEAASARGARGVGSGSPRLRPVVS